MCVLNQLYHCSLWSGAHRARRRAPRQTTSHEYYYFLRMRRHIAIAQNLNFNSAVRGIMESPMLRDEDIRLSFVSSSKLSPSADSRISNFSLRWGICGVILIGHLKSTQFMSLDSGTFFCMELSCAASYFRGYASTEINRSTVLCCGMWLPFLSCRPSYDAASIYSTCLAIYSKQLKLYIALCII